MLSQLCALNNSVYDEEMVAICEEGELNAMLVDLCMETERDQVYSSGQTGAGVKRKATAVTQSSSKRPSSQEPSTSTGLLTTSTSTEGGSTSFAVVIGSMNLVAISSGFTYGHLTGMIRSLQKKEDDIDLSEGQLSLLSACLAFCMIIGLILLGLFGEIIGRRWIVIIFSIPLLISWTLLYFAKEFLTILLSRILAGASIGALGIINLVTAAEFTSPKFRALIQSLVSMVAPALGTGLGHILGVLFHWRSLCLFGMAMVIIHICLPIFWVESPQWLASRGRFEECENAFRKLHGSNPKSEGELGLLINIESSKQKKAKEINKNTVWNKVLNSMKRKYFWCNIIVTDCVIYLYYSAAGKVVFNNLATIMLEEITGTEDILLFTLLVDVFILLGTCVSIFLIKKMTIRVLLFTSGLIANVILVAFSIALYFKNDETYSQWINVTLLAIYFIIVHAGPYPVLEILLGELFPLDIKLFCFFLTIPVFVATICSGIMLMPILAGYMGYHGLFLLNAVTVFICLAYFWVRLPETKGKTLQEIELYFKSDNKYDVDKTMNHEQIKAFI